jgi:hypothetical protein
MTAGATTNAVNTSNKATAALSALTRRVGTVGAMVSFQEGSELLIELAGVAVDAKQVERTAEALGNEIAEDERHCTEPSDALPLYLGMDGTGIPPVRPRNLTRCQEKCTVQLVCIVAIASVGGQHNEN